MNWWQWALTGAGVVLTIPVLYLAWGFLLMSGKRCRCGHGDRVHVGRNTDCAGWCQTDAPNALGISLPRRCECPQYRQTERRVWERVFIGFEESR